MKWIFIMSLIGFLLMGYDKSQAIGQEFRVPEIALFGVAFLGGAPGIGAGMLVFWHKVRKIYFVIGIPILIFFNLSSIFSEPPRKKKKRSKKSTEERLDKIVKYYEDKNKGR